MSTMALVLIMVVLFFSRGYKLVGEEAERFETISSLKSLLSAVPLVQVSLFLVMLPLIFFQVAQFSCFVPGYEQRDLS